MSLFNNIKDVFYSSPNLINIEEEVKKKYLERLEEISKKVETLDITNIKWNEKVSMYSKELYKIKEILDELEKEDNKQTIQKVVHRINQYIEKSKNPIYEIAFVGAVKAGKSTLINAILNKNLASTEVTPETAALTKFKFAKNGRDYVKINFYTLNEWETLWKSAVDSNADVFLEDYKKLDAEAQKDNWVNKENKEIFVDTLEELKATILKYTSSRSATHYFVKEVEVGLKDFAVPEQVCFVDTPGLDDVVDFRSNITRQYIDSANAVIVCVKSDSLRSDELLTISRVFANTRNNPEKVFVVGTQIDSLNNPKDDWSKQREEWTKYLKGKACYDDLELTNKNLIGTSAYVYNLAQRFEELSDEEKQSLGMYCVKTGVKILEFNELANLNEHLPLKLDIIKNNSNVLVLQNIINKDLLSTYNQNLLDDFTNKYQSIKFELDEYAKTQILKIDEFVNLSTADIATIKAERDKKIQELEEIEKKKKELSIYLNTLRIHVGETAEKLAKDIQSIGNNL
ncbi:MAG: dynamin family protein [Cetobacterium sp.]